MSKIALSGNASGTGTLTIAAPNTNTDRTLTLPDNTGTVLTTASNITAQAMNGPALWVTSSTDQVFSAGTTTVIAFGAETFDTNSCFDTSTYRFTPNVAGYYQLNVQISAKANTSNEITIVCRKNGSQATRLGRSYGSSASTIYFGGSLVLNFNGTTDYVDFTCYTQAAFTSESPYTIFSACFVRAA